MGARWALSARRAGPSLPFWPLLPFPSSSTQPPRDGEVTPSHPVPAPLTWEPVPLAPPWPGIRPTLQRLLPTALLPCSPEPRPCCRSPPRCPQAPAFHPHCPLLPTVPASVLMESSKALLAPEPPITPQCSAADPCFDCLWH